MRYYKYPDDDIFVNGTVYLEEDDGCTFRQIIVSGEQRMASNLKYPNEAFALPDGWVDYDAFEEDFEGVISITQQEFDAVWNQHLLQNHHYWEKVKALYPTGMQITGAILIFYPQGVIVDLGSGALGIAGYAQCQASAQPEWMYPKHQIKAVVAGYDEKNQWIKLMEPQVLAKTIN